MLKQVQLSAIRTQAEVWFTVRRRVGTEQLLNCVRFNALFTALARDIKLVSALKSCLFETMFKLYFIC